MSPEKDRITQLIRPEIQRIKAYDVADASGYIKLDAMENPYTWSDSLKNEWLTELRQVEINRYPHPKAPELVSEIRKVMQVSDDFSVLLGNGSDEIIQLLIMAVAKEDTVVMAPLPGFVMYQMIATYVGVGFRGVDLKPDFSLNKKLMLDEIEQYRPQILFLAQPNNPTGNLWAEEDLREIIQKMDDLSCGLVVLDEAYLAFSSRNHLSWLHDYKNIVVMRTLSKVGLAGLRLGMLFGHKEWLDEIDKVRMPYNINSLTQCSATFALRHYQTLDQQALNLRDIRQSVMQRLPSDYFEVFDSEANFILVRCRGFDANRLFEYLKDHNILIKCLHGAHPLLDNCLRLTVGSQEEMDQLLHHIAQFVATI